MARRPSPQTIAVLRAFAADAQTWRYGYELGQQVGLKAGSLYPILIRLCDRDLLEASWESEAPQGRPPRHLYRLTTRGVALAAELSPQLAAADRSAAPTASRRARVSPAAGVA
ncbi:PadR family transcriptional regulator [Jatrophihabitans sp. GAS493]|uniref:PadR family transcriptional regulator n=1 Tax=Jatrophihabitans sp. GAS493 TaxID=1907575 RepID=UPI000BB97CB7|nr:PadR family transcriptional regulator [Jatrophihabitans sp. GAS493]SOD72344.1 PadR family transcriptional regulator [Jatrophihabitans sp. GAS493]